MAQDTQRNLNFISFPGISSAALVVVHVFGARLRAPQLKLKFFWHPRERRRLHLERKERAREGGKKQRRAAPTPCRIWTFVSAALVSPKLSRSCNPTGEGGEKREADGEKKPTLEHSENEEKPRRQMAETISPIRRSYFSCHARVCEDAVSISEHRHEAELLPLLWLDDWTRAAFVSDQQESTLW